MIKKLLVIIAVLLLAAPCFAKPRWYNATDLTGGDSTDVDAINGQNLYNGDKCVVVTASGKTYIYNLDVDSALTESSPSVISPDSNAGDKRWILIWSGGRVIIPDSTIDQGDNGVDGTLAWHITNAAGSNVVVTVLEGTYKITTDITVPITMQLDIKKGGVFKPDTSKKLTVYSPENILAGRRQQIVDLTSNSTDPLVFTVPGTRYVGWWGAKGDGGTTDNAEEFQAAIASVVGGTVFIPEDTSYYSYSTAIRTQSETVIQCESPATHLYADTSGTKWPLTASVVFGSYQENNRENLDDDDYTLDAVTKAAESVTTTTAGEAANFAAGDIVWVHSTDTFVISGTTFYTWGQINVVVSATAGTGVIVLRHPMQESGTATIANLSDNGDDFLFSDDSDTGFDNFATRDAKILGGTWENANSAGLASFTAAGGAIDCVVDIHQSIATNSPAWGNMLAHCTFKTKIVKTYRRVVELAMQCHNNIVEFDTVFCDASGTAATALIWFGEASRDNTVKINKIVTDSDDDTLVRFNETKNNSVEITHAEIPAIANSVIMFRTTTATGTVPNCEGNKVRILSSITTSALSQYVVFDGDQTYRNMVYDSNFYGTLATNPNGTAVNLDTSQSASLNTVRNCVFEDGRILISSGADGYIIDGNSLHDGIAATMDTDGAISVANFAYMAINTFESAASDNLDTLSGGVKGATLILYPIHTDRTVVLRDGQDNLAIAGNFTMDDATDSIALFFDGTNWVELSRSAN